MEVHSTYEITSPKLETRSSASHSSFDTSGITYKALCHIAKFIGNATLLDKVGAIILGIVAMYSRYNRSLTLLLTCDIYHAKV